MEDIDDEQIIQLLLAAEVRMAKSNTSTSPPGVEKTEEQRSNRIPKLEIGAIAQPYISSQNGIASADHRRLIPSGTSSPSPALIGEVRKPVTTKKASKVCDPSFIAIVCEENTQHILKQNYRPRLELALQT